MAGADDNNPVVSYTVKDLINRVEAKVDLILDRLDGKADKTVVVAIEERLYAVETQCAVTAAVSRNTRWILVGAFPAVLGAAVAIQSFIR